MSNDSHTPMRWPIEIGRGASRIELTAAALLDDRISRGLAARPTLPIVLGTPATSERIKRLVPSLPRTRLGDEGFCVRTVVDGQERVCVIAADQPSGVLYGAATAAERSRIVGSFDALDMIEQPKLDHRNLWTWAGPSPHRHSFFHLEAIAEPEKHPRFTEFLYAMAAWRLNAITLWPHNEWRPDYGRHAEEVTPAYQTFTRFLRERTGVEIYLFAWYEFERIKAMPHEGWPLCPFDERVRKRWADITERLGTQFPDVTGLVMAGAGGDWLRGPFECSCEKCRRHTHRELLIEGMKMVAEPLARHGKKIIWKAVTDRPTLVKTELENFANLDEHLPENVIIAHKNFYKDFRQPHPFHPIFFAHKPAPQNSRPYLCEVQIYGEYRGHDQFPCVMVDRWHDIFPMLDERGYRGALAICSLEEQHDWDHPLNMVNWYAFGRFAWDPLDEPTSVLCDWATLTFGADAADRVVEVLRMTYEAATKLMFFRGILIQNHSKLPTNDYELESSLIGPWHDIPKAPDGYIGRGHDVSFYPPDVAEQIRNDPKLLLWANRVPITTELCDEAIAQQDEVIRLVQTMIDKWDALGPTADPALHAKVAEQFRRNLADAQLWREDIALYFDYKARRLTRTELRRRLDAIRQEFDSRPRSKLTSGELYERFLFEWERVYNGDLTRRVMEGAHHDPNGTTFLPGLQPE